MKRLVLAVVLLSANSAFAQEVSAPYDASAPSLADMAQQEAYAATYPQPLAPAAVQQTPQPEVQQHQPVDPVELFYYSAPDESYNGGSEIAPISNLNF